MSRLLRFIGTLFALFCLGVLVVRQLPNLPPLDLTSPLLWGATAVSVVFYLVSQISSAEAWRAILSHFQVQISPALARSQLLLSQIGKYIPGNVAHLFGRIAIGRRDGVPGSILAIGMLMEVGSTLAVSLGIAGVLLLMMPDALPDVTAQFPDLSNRVIAFLIAGLIAAAVGIGAYFLRARLRRIDAPRPPLASLGIPLVLYLLSFAAHGVSLWAVSWAIAPEVVPNILTCTLIFAFAWSAGFLMPGAPAGIGVRDAILVLGLAVSVGQGPAVAIALLHRAVTVLGDVCTFGIGWLMRRARTSQNGPEAAAFVAD